MARMIGVLALLGALSVPSEAGALDDSQPTVRVGAAVGVAGTLPVGSDVGQDGYPDEFEKGLWLHVDVLQVDIGDYVQLSWFFRMGLAGGYSGDTLGQSIDPTRLASSPNPKLAMTGLTGRFFPFGDGKVRPFLSFGAAYSMAGARLKTCPDVVANPPMDAMGDGEMAGEGQMSGAGQQADAEPVETVGNSDCVRDESLVGASRKHQGLAFTFGVGVRFDPTIHAFDEPWRLPISLEFGYVKNVWLGMERDPEGIWENGELETGPDDALKTNPDAVASNKPNVDYLGLLLTVGFLR